MNVTTPEEISAGLENAGQSDLLSEGTSKYITAVLPMSGGGQIRYLFPNGRGASVIRVQHRRALVGIDYRRLARLRSRH